MSVQSHTELLGTGVRHGAVLGREGRGRVCHWCAASLSFCFCCLFSEIFPSSGIKGLCSESALK